MSSTVCMAKDFNGGDLLSDQRMSLFSWWFEKHCTELSSAGRNTYTLTPQSLAINGIKVGNPDSLLNDPDITEKRKDFFNTAEKNALPKASREEFSAVLSEFKAHLEKLLHLAKKGKMLADSALQNRTKIPYVSTELSRIDSQILNSDAKNAAALVFPTQRQLDELSRDFPKDKETLPMFQSRLIYSELIKAISRYTNELNKYF